jgi:serine/threonine-protein kinase SRPK3
MRYVLQKLSLVLSMGPRRTYGRLAAWFVLNPIDHSFIQLKMQTFELLTGRWLFDPQGGPTWRLEDDHLAKMMELTAENFDDGILAKSRKRDEYFDKSSLYTILAETISLFWPFVPGKLLCINELFPTTLENSMKNYGLVEAEAASATSFILACLHLNQEVRSSASELLNHPWLESAYMCC